MTSVTNTRTHPNRGLRSGIRKTTTVVGSVALPALPEKVVPNIEAVPGKVDSGCDIGPCGTVLSDLFRCAQYKPTLTNVTRYPVTVRLRSVHVPTQAYSRSCKPALVH